MAIGPQLQAILDRYGLGSLADWASTAIIQGWSEDQILLELYNRPEFKARFPAIDARRNLHLPPISIDEYLQYEKMASSLGSTWGLSLSKAEVDALITNDVSAVELEQRFNIAATALYDSDIETRQELERLFNVSTPQLMRYWMDPKKELPALQQQYRMGEVAGAALRTGFGQITADQALRLTEAGLNRESASRGFALLASSQELFTPINFGETAIDTPTQIEFLAGDAAAAQAIEAQAQRRKAEFEGGGQYASSQQGFATGKAKSA